MNRLSFLLWMCKGTKNILYTQYLIYKNGAKSFLLCGFGVFLCWSYCIFTSILKVW